MVLSGAWGLKSHSHLRVNHPNNGKQVSGPRCQQRGKRLSAWQFTYRERVHRELQTFWHRCQSWLVVCGRGIYIIEWKLMRQGYMFLPWGHSTGIWWSGDSGHCSGQVVWTWCWKDQPTDWRGWRGDAAGSAAETGSACGALGMETTHLLYDRWIDG